MFNLYPVGKRPPDGLEITWPTQGDVWRYDGLLDEWVPTITPQTDIWELEDPDFEDPDRPLPWIL